MKNYWNTKLSKKLRQRGIDPITHRPIADLMNSIGALAIRPPQPAPSPPRPPRAALTSSALATGTAGPRAGGGACRLVVEAVHGEFDGVYVRGQVEARSRIS